MDRIAEGADIGMFDDDSEIADRLIADMACMRAQLMVQRGDRLEARHYYTIAIDTLRREHGRQHQLIRHIEIARRRLSGKRTHRS
jgi:hypothetical protein